MQDSSGRGACEKWRAIVSRAQAGCSGLDVDKHQVHTPPYGVATANLRTAGNVLHPLPVTYFALCAAFAVTMLDALHDTFCVILQHA